jgi:hypothetical protein
MIIISSGPVVWESSDAQRLREFLDSSTGKRVLEHLASVCPSPYDGGNANLMVAEAKKIEGFQDAVSSLVNLTREQPPQPTAEEQYPDLNDDSKWKTK